MALSDPGTVFPSSQPETRGEGLLELVVASAFVLAAGLAALYHPERTMLRTLLAVPALLVVPGYVLLEAALSGSPSRPARLDQLAYSVGLSPAVIGLVALTMALTPSGFRSAPIILGVMGGTSLALVEVAGYRRLEWARQPSTP